MISGNCEEELAGELRKRMMKAFRARRASLTNLPARGRFSGALAGVAPNTIYIHAMHGGYGTNRSAIAQMHAEAVINSSSCASIKMLKWPAQMRLAVGYDARIAMRLRIAAYQIIRVSGPT